MSNRDKRHTGTPADPVSIERQVHLEDGAKIDFVESLKKSQSEEHDENIRIQRWQLWLAAITAILLFITAGFAFWQGYSSQRSADAAKEAADTANKALVDSRRAWIEPVIESVNEVGGVKRDAKVVLEEFANSKIISAHYKMRVIGRVPVTDVKIRATLEVLNSDEAPTFSYPWPVRENRDSIIYPDREMEIASMWWGEPEHHAQVVGNKPLPAPFTEELRDQFWNGKKYVVSYGEGTFNDPLGKHWLRFCNLLAMPNPELVSVSLNALSCTSYNSAGDGDLPQ